MLNLGSLIPASLRWESGARRLSSLSLAELADRFALVVASGEIAV